MRRPRLLQSFAVLALALLLAVAVAPRKSLASEDPMRSGGDASPNQVSLDQVIRPDGTLDLHDFRGSVSTTGWRLSKDANGVPRFVREGTPGKREGASMAPIGVASGADDCWSAITDGVNGPSGALALDGAGNLYVGGDFTVAGGGPANYIARWNGVTWSSLRSGTNGNVLALTVDGAGNLYAGGIFTQADGSPANHVARWDGSNWFPVGGGTNGFVYTLVWRGSTLYAGGNFSQADGNSAIDVAQWDGTNWSAMGSGLNNTVRTLVMDPGGTLYAGGYFTASGGTTVRGVGKWDANTSSWSEVSTGLNTGGVVWALALDGYDLYAGGNFATIGGVTASNIAKWNGSTWSALGSGVDYLGVISLAVAPNQHVFAGGYFSNAGGTPAVYVAEWNGSAWSALGAGSNGNVGVLLADPAGNVYMGGGLTVAGGAPANNIAKWDGSEWSVLGGGVDAPALCIALDGLGNLYAGGLFAAADGLPANRVVKWNGTIWSTLGSGMDHFVYTLAPDGLGNVYAGGSFTTAGGVSANRVAKWDGANWSALGAGMNSTVRTLVLDGGSLYAGGLFTTADGASAPGVAKWDGINWSSLGTGITGVVYALVRDGMGNLYAGGTFQFAGGVAASNIAKWNGVTWSPLGLGVDYLGVLSLAHDGLGNLYAGGYFSNAGGVPASYIAKWNGTAWSALGSGSNGNVGVLLADRSGNVYAGGGISVLGGISALNIGRWDGSSWSAMGAGANDLVDGLALDGSGHLYVAGNFTRAGGKPAGALARYDVPAITSFTPNQGGSGTQVSISGYNLSGATAVLFNGTSAIFVVNSNTSITATVPPGSTAGPIRVVSQCAGALSVETYFPGPCAPVPPDLVSWWRLDGNADDLLNRHDGTVVGDPTFAAGLQAQAFQATGSTVAVPDGPGLNPTQFTLDAWVKMDVLPAGIPVILWKGDFGSNLTSPFELAVYGTAQPANQEGRAIVAIGNPSGLQEVNADRLFPLGAWVHLAATADGLNLKLYQNGILVGSQPQTLTPGASSYPFRIGGTHPQSGDNFFLGLIDEVEIHSSAATAAQIFAIYQAGPASKCLNTLSVPEIAAPSVLSLSGAPNPTALNVALSFSVPAPAAVWLDVLDVTGRHVRSLMRGQLVVGAQRVTWDGRSDAGNLLAPGVYLARMRTASETRTASIVLLGR